jgi:hypothetical protein
MLGLFCREISAKCKATDIIILMCHWIRLFGSVLDDTVQLHTAAASCAWFGTCLWWSNSEVNVRWHHSNCFIFPDLPYFRRSFNRRTVRKKKF